MKESLFDALGGYDILRRVHKIFYDKVYADPWLKQFFTGQEQWFIEKQQTHFMAGKFGGPDEFCGKPPQHAHTHMYITEELFNVRLALLRESLAEANVTPGLMARWLKIDSAFRNAVVKPSLEAFHAEHTFKTRIIVPGPPKNSS